MCKSGVENVSCQLFVLYFYFLWMNIDWLMQNVVESRRAKKVEIQDMNVAAGGESYYLIDIDVVEGLNPADKLRILGCIGNISGMRNL